MRGGTGRAWIVLVAVLSVGACRDDGPRGPGTWNGLVRSSTTPPGAVILEVQGTGIAEVEGVGPVRAFALRLTGPDTGAGNWRVLLLTPTPGDMGFRVRVDDVGTGAPRAVVMSAVDGEDQPVVGVASFSVEMELR